MLQIDYSETYSIRSAGFVLEYHKISNNQDYFTEILETLRESTDRTRMVETNFQCDLDAFYKMTADELVMFNKTLEVRIG